MYFMIPFRHPQFSGHNLYRLTLPRAKMSGPSKLYRNMFMNLLRSQQSTSMIFKLQGKWQLAMQKMPSNYRPGHLHPLSIYGPGLGSGLSPSSKVKLGPLKGLQSQAQPYLGLGPFFRCRAPGLLENKGLWRGLGPPGPITKQNPTLKCVTAKSYISQS